MTEQADMAMDGLNAILKHIRFEIVDGQVKISRVDALVNSDSTTKEAEQLTAVQKHGYAIEFVGNPSDGLPRAEQCPASEAVQLAAVQNYGNAIRFIKNPSEGLPGAGQCPASEAVQLAAIRDKVKYIMLIRCPTPAPCTLLF